MHGNVPGKDYHRTHNFVCPGVERNGGATGFAYGSDAYSKSLKKFDRLPSEKSLNGLKFRKHQKDAEHDIQTYHEARMQMQQEKIAEKKQDLELLQTYKPWGKPAPGAPRFTKSGTMDMRKKRLEPDVDSIHYTPSDEYNPFGRPGGGAPLRTTSGELHAQIKTNPTIRFQDHLKKEVQESLRYRNSGGSQERKQEEGRVYRTESEKEKLANAREKKLRYGRQLEEQRIEMLERKAAVKADEEALNNLTFPWGKSKVDRDESGKVKRRKWQLGQESDYPDSTDGGVGFQLGQPGSGAPLRDSAGRVKTRRLHAEDVSSSSQYDPWGKPGAGAPIKNKQGEIVTTVCGKIEKEDDELRKPHKRSALPWLQEKRHPSKLNPVTGQQIDTVSTIHTSKILNTLHPSTETDKLSHPQRGDSQGSGRQYFTDLQLQAEQRQQELKHNKDAERKLEQQHAKHAAYMWEDKHSRREQPFARTSWEEKDEGAVVKKKEYYTDLQKLMNERKIHKAQSREIAIQKETEHVLVYGDQWGRPGGGAPNSRTARCLSQKPRCNA